MSRPTDSPTLIQEAACGVSVSVSVSARGGGGPLRRLVLLSYVPAGFWPRLCTRLLADPALAAAPAALYRLPPELEVDATTAKAVELQWSWKLWKSGMRLSSGPLELLALLLRPPARDPLLPAAPLHDPLNPHPYHNLRLRVRQDGSWCELDIESSACVELLLPAQVCVVRRDDGLPLAGYQSISLEPNPETLAKVLALVSDHVDLLLEDWYPSLGTRFVHTSEGRCLITRAVPCPSCLKEARDTHTPSHDNLALAFRSLDMDGAEPDRPRLSEESRTSDGDSGVGAESNASSRLGSVEGIARSPPPVTFGWTVEDCILAACSGRRLHCPHHAHVELRHVAPDTLLLDVEESRRARWEDIRRGAVAGRGAFGTVLEAWWRRPGGAQACPVALKALQPVAPTSASDGQAMQAYKAGASRWEREPVAAACRAYLGLRQELSILSRVRHPHVVTLLGVCAAPLALLLELAPQGALDAALRQYRGCGRRLGPRVARLVGLQVARALEHLHAERILYRDLKSENVLVWRLPRVQEAAALELGAQPLDVLVKLADYGISRLAPPSGTKGFGGTEGFMAPEIMRYNGEEEYNEKVDCFSYGMLLYELVTGRQPFEGHEAVKEAVLEGARPSLTARELQYPCSMLESMRRCWAGAPELRPSAAALVSVGAAPEYAALMDAAAARAATAAAAVPLRVLPEEGMGGWEVWFGGGEPERLHTLLATSAAFTQQHTIRIPPADKAQAVMVTAMCRVGHHVWVGDSAGRLSVFSARSCALQWAVALHEAVGGAPAAVAALQPLGRLRRVALALATGRLFLVSSERPEAEGSFVLTELGTATELCCLAAVPTAQGVELWAGGDGQAAFAVRAGGVCAADRAGGGRVTLLAAAPQHACVLAYTYPGSTITQWSVVSKRPAAKLDCSKLVPCSESLQSISIDEHLPPEKCRVTALCALASEVYVGTAWGCIIVADVATLRPLTVFRPYEEDVRAIVPLLPHEGVEEGPMLATFGTGYRPLLQRYAPVQPNSNTTHAGFHCLLWRAQHWLPD